MQALHVIAGLDARHGGPSYSVPRLTEALEKAECRTDLFTLGDQCSANNPVANYLPQALSRVPALSSLKLSPALYQALLVEAARADVVHNHGLWLMPNVYAGQAATKAGRPLIISPRGMLAPAALLFSTWKKRIFWTCLQEKAFTKAAAWHATSTQEAGEIRAFGVKAPIAVIPNGIDLPGQMASHNPAKTQRTILFLSRIHPKKGLPALLEAWRQLAADRPDWQVVIVGPDEGGHRAELEAIVRSKQIPRVTFSDPVYGETKDALLAEADLFVLPTLSENFGIAVAEALAAGLPAIVTTGAPWQGLDIHRCGWWIEQGIDPLLAALGEATALPASERQAMGLRGRDWMRRDFGWDAIGREMKDVYLWVTGQGDRPPSIHL